MTPPWASPLRGDVLVRVKAVPGASRNRVQGTLGDHLKIQVAAPPEGGKANAAIQALLADLFGVACGSIRLESGAASPRKVFRIPGMTESVFLEERFSDLRPGG